MEYVFPILAFIVVMFILLFTTKFLNYKSKKLLKGNYMHVVESLSLGANVRIHLIKVDKEFYIISSSNKTVEFLAKVDINDYEEKEIKNPISEVIDFKSILMKHVNKVSFNTMKNSNTQSKSNKADEKVDSVNNVNTFKNNLDKLKHLNKSINNQWGQNEQEKEN